jgi:2-C-methyl-D-erythritol 2,4-cyclodiphosphate synthase
MQARMRIGHGWDLHRLAEGRRLILGGVAIPFDKGLAGHSDADVVIHALVDALLGAMGAGDIGTLFPDSDPALADANSRDLLRHVMEDLRRAGYAVINVDLTIVAEAPRIGPHRMAIRTVLAEALGVSEECVSVKAKTAEGCGSEGRGEAISASAVALLGPREV